MHGGCCRLAPYARPRSTWSPVSGAWAWLRSFLDMYSDVARSDVITEHVKQDVTSDRGCSGVACTQVVANVAV